MAQKDVPEQVAMRDFSGLVTNQDPEDLPPGAARVQVNVRGDRPGELRPRQGWVRVFFES